MSQTEEAAQFLTMEGSRYDEVQDLRQSSNTRGHHPRNTSEYSGISAESDCSKELPPKFSGEPGPSDPKSEEKQQLDVQQSESSISVRDESWVLDHKESVRRRCERVTEGCDGAAGGAGGAGSLLSSIYTELYITEGHTEELQREHELTQLETSSTTSSLHDAPIRCQDIFTPGPGQNKPKAIRTVLSIGVAGAGKTFSVLKFSLDWAEGRENQDVTVLVVLSFRELNLIKDDPYSLLGLLAVFHPSFQKVPAEELELCRLLFILDGLDESRLSLNFRPNLYDVTQESSVGSLITNLIQGNLLPSAQVWITSRPAAANEIPWYYVDRLTEVRGFTDAQKEEFFRRRFREQELCSRITKHVQSCRSLHVMCGIPVFCWITATVLEHMLTSGQRGELPTNLTDMYCHFVLVQTIRKKIKYHEGAETSPQQLKKTDWELLLKLGRLAFEHLDQGNIMFYQEDLQHCGLDETEASVYSGVCTQIFRRESVIFQKPVYSFVHLSVQEFLAAVYMMHCFTNRKNDVMEKFLRQDYFLNPFSSLGFYLELIMRKSLSNPNGHLDLFVRFLHGLCLESNQKLLAGLLGRTENSPETIQRVIKNLKEMKCEEVSPDRSINIFHCLMEMKDLSVHQQVQQFLQSQDRKQELSEIQCSALCYMLQMSDQILEELDLKKYNTSLEGRRRLIPAVRNCRTARLQFCPQSETLCGVVSSALKSDPSYLTHLDLSCNKLEDAAVKHLCVGLQSPNCKLKTLRLMCCIMTQTGSSSVVSTIRNNSSLKKHLKHLDLSSNELQDSGVYELCALLQSPPCGLKTLRLDHCWLTPLSCSSLATTLMLELSHLTELHLKGNNLQNKDVKELMRLKSHPDFSLRTLRWRNDH